MRMSGHPSKETRLTFHNHQTHQSKFKMLQYVNAFPEHAEITVTTVSCWYLVKYSILITVYYLAGKFNPSRSTQHMARSVGSWTGFFSQHRFTHNSIRTGNNNINSSIINSLVGWRHTVSCCMKVFKLILNRQGIKLSWINWVHIMVADALAPCVASRVGVK